ncbi:MAG: carboxypeptidase regulatory-like domain-containing protein [Gemmatimonadetes bacterium]|nr:carboxypeptidase regulatory-like domain-containing protein [Gemmatimonadota bacterium]
MQRPLAVVAMALAMVSASEALLAQTVQGRVLDDEDDRPVGTAVVRLLDGDGEQRAIAAADSLGRYSLEVPEPGVYRLRAERLGYHAMETPLLEMGRADGLYPLDLLVRRAPVPIEGLEVTNRDVDRRVRLLTGISPAALRWRPLRQEDLRDHVERAHDLTALMRWGNYAGIEVMEYDDGPCYLMRRYGCLPVYLDGFPLTPGAFDLVALDMLHTVLVVAPNESIQYPRGGVLMYTPGWIR